MKARILTIVIVTLITTVNTKAQEKALTNTANSKFAKLESINIGDVQWTEGFWAERFEVCKNSMVPHMMGCYLDDTISHAFKNFEIAAGLDKGEHIGPPFHDGDFYKILEAEIMVYAATRDEKLEKEINHIIDIIGKTQRDDGYIHTPTGIKERKTPDKKHDFAERLDFETYNMGHLMTAACIHYRITGKKNLLDIAIKATDFLYNFYKRAADELAKNAICPSHYMGVVEMYRTTHDAKYLELAKGLIDIRDMVVDGTDHNQDRIPFRQQTEAIGHAVRANYLYAGVADVYAETGEDSLMIALENIWNDLVEHKLYITGACGALYDGVSPNGTTYSPSFIQQVHQAYGSGYELPNISAHNESCANIGNLLWNWRMLQVTKDAKYADIMETVMYNSLLAGVSLDGKRYFYTNPLGVANEISHGLRWSKDREEYISYCNCCPPNTIRTIAEIQEYFYSVTEKGLYVNFYGGNKLNTKINRGQISLEQVSDYPWDGHSKIIIEKMPAGFSIFLRIPQWADKPVIKLNGEKIEIEVKPGSYFELKNNWCKGDKIELILPVKAKLIEANPLVESTRNQVAVKWGPVVYCLESPDIKKNTNIFNYKIDAGAKIKPVMKSIANSEILILKSEFLKEENKDWDNSLYKELSVEKPEKVKINLIPYYAWNNRGKSEMTIWIPLAR